MNITVMYICHHCRICDGIKRKDGTCIYISFTLCTCTCTYCCSITRPLQLLCWKYSDLCTLGMCMYMYTYVTYRHMNSYIQTCCLATFNICTCTCTCTCMIMVAISLSTDVLTVTVDKYKNVFQKAFQEVYTRTAHTLYMYIVQCIYIYSVHVYRRTVHCGCTLHVLYELMSE